MEQKSTNLVRIASNADTTAKKAEFNEKRIMSALSIARLNAEEQLAAAEERKETFTMGSDTAEQTLQSLVDIFSEIHAAKETLERIAEVETYLSAEC